MRYHVTYMAQPNGPRHQIELDLSWPSDDLTMPTMEELELILFDRLGQRVTVTGYYGGGSGQEAPDADILRRMAEARGEQVDW